VEPVDTQVSRCLEPVRLSSSFALACAVAVAAASPTLADGGGGPGVTPTVLTPQFMLGTNDSERGDVMLKAVDFGHGLVFNRFIYASEITDFQWSGPTGKLRITVGPDVTEDAESFKLESGDGNDSNITQTDFDVFNAHAAAAFQSSNLNHFVDINSAAGAEFSCIVHFERAVKDNRWHDDEIPEILYFERGTGGANSYLTIEAVDMDGNVIGNPLLLSPAVAIHTTPEARVATLNSSLDYNGWQTMTGVGVDLSHLGVDSIWRLRMRSPRPGDTDAEGNVFTSGEISPDFKLCVIQTVDVNYPAWYVGD